MCSTFIFSCTDFALSVISGLNGFHAFTRNPEGTDDLTDEEASGVIQEVLEAAKEARDRLTTKMANSKVRLLDIFLSFFGTTHEKFLEFRRLLELSICCERAERFSWLEMASFLSD